jgi:hypothetical protein
MNIILSAIRSPGQLTCAWVPTGDSRTPLVCVWKEASLSLVGRTPLQDLGCSPHPDLAAIYDQPSACDSAVHSR